MRTWRELCGFVRPHLAAKPFRTVLDPRFVRAFVDTGFIDTRLVDTKLINTRLVDTKLIESERTISSNNHDSRDHNCSCNNHNRPSGDHNCSAASPCHSSSTAGSPHPNYC